MNTYPSASRCHSTRPGRAPALLVCLMIVAILLPGGAVWTVQAAPPAQEAPPGRLPYDGPFDLPRLPGDATQSEPDQALTAPEYVDWSKLVFQSARNSSDWEIYAARGDGSDQVNISNHAGMDVHPRLNRGATRVVFASNRHGTYDLFTMNADGGGQARIVDSPSDDVFPAWSPDSSRIAFQAYRDGQPEIYVANADGSGQARLTNHGDYDGQPAWSPDGSQIAFVRRESGGYRIWAMNADGSNQRPLSSQAYSADPAWAPDGSQIAYDADGNGDGWQEIWLMNADGSNQRGVYAPPESNTDAWVGSWSPDGRYVAFTRISFVYNQGQWYWTVAYLDAWDSTQPWNTIRLSSNGADWNPDWGSTDGQAPASRVLTLPAQSPATFTVYWSGDDTGGSGLKDFDVQIREGAAGIWTDWQTGVTATSASYTGVGGRRYYFRARGRDNAGNVEAWPADHDAVTTVESNPPQTAVEALPAYSRNGLLVRWGGSDPGGSGIQSYDVQVREASSAWTDWRMGVTETSATFTGTAGVEYRFRARARDRAQNVEVWPATADAITTLYTWAIAGTVTDNRGAQVAGMTTSTSPAAFHTALSNRDGAYAAHVSTEAASYSASWSKSGYGALPSTEFPHFPNATSDVVLPPANNVVQNWGFEDGSSSWQFSGSLTTTITNSVQHSGDSSALLGSGFNPFRTTTSVTDEIQDGSPLTDFVIEAGHTIHGVWTGLLGRIMYSKGLSTMGWSTPEMLPGPVGGRPRLFVDGVGTVHVLWISEATPRALYYSHKQVGAGWTASERVPGSDSALTAGVALGANGIIKVAWASEGTSSTGAIYSCQRNPTGIWTVPRQLSTDDAVPWMMIATDPTGRAHVLWMSRDNNSNHQLLYATETADGSWISQERVSQAGVGGSDMVIDSYGTAHVAWTYQGGVYYGQRPSGASWSLEMAAAPSDAQSGLSLIVDRLGRVHIVWDAGISSQLKYAMRLEGTWSIPSGVNPPGTEIPYHAKPTLAVGDDLVIQVLWSEDHWPSPTVHYARRELDGTWSQTFNAQHSTGPGIPPQLLLDSLASPHALWNSWGGQNWSILYAGPEPATSNGDANASQVVAVPGTMPAPTLSFWHRFDTEISSNSGLEAIVDDGISATVVFSTTTDSNNWTHQWVDLGPWAGHGVTVRFRVIEEAGGSHVSAYIDEVTVGSTHPDIWVSQPAWQAAPAGRTFETTLTYGNRGGVAASGGQVTLQLPAELSFVSANPPPSAMTPTLSWDVGALPAQSGPQTIRVTLQMAASAAGGSTVTTTAGITSSTTELEQANNTAQGSVFIGSIRYLPVIMR